MSSLKRSTVNMISSAVGYILPMAVNIATTPLLLKGLGETAYGLQSLVNVIIGYMAFMDMGLDIPIIKILAESKAKNDFKSINNLLNTTFQLYSIIALIGMIVIILLSQIFVIYIFPVPINMTHSAIIVFQLAGIGFLGSIFLSWGRAVAFGMQRFELSYSVSVGTSIAGTLIGLAAVYTGWGIIGYVFVRVIFTLISGPIYLYLTTRLLPEFHFHFGLDRSTLLAIKSYIGYGILNRATSSLFSRIDQTLIGIWVSIAAAGIYAIPFMVVSSLGSMIAFMLGFIFPMASELFSLGKLDQFRGIYIRASRFLVAISTMAFIPLLILGDIFLTLWVPSIASRGIGVFKLLILASYFNTICASITNNVVIGMGKIRQFTIYANIRGIVLGILCILFIYLFGLIGAGWALLLTVSVDIIYLFVFLSRYIRLSPLLFIKQAYAKPILLGGIIAVLGLFLHPFIHSWLSLVFGIIFLELSYIIVGFRFGIFGETEKRAIIGLLETVNIKTKLIK